MDGLLGIVFLAGTLVFSIVGGVLAIKYNKWWFGLVVVGATMLYFNLTAIVDNADLSSWGILEVAVYKTLPILCPVGLLLVVAANVFPSKNENTKEN